MLAKFELPKVSFMYGSLFKYEYKLMSKSSKPPTTTRNSPIVAKSSSNFCENFAEYISTPKINSTGRAKYVKNPLYLPHIPNKFSYKL